MNVHGVRGRCLTQVHPCVLYTCTVYFCHQELTNTVQRSPMVQRENLDIFVCWVTKSIFCLPVLASWHARIQMSSEDIERRKRLESAVEGDDWSGVIDGQTKLTEDPKVAGVDAPTATIIRYILSGQASPRAFDRRGLFSWNVCICSTVRFGLVRLILAEWTNFWRANG